MLGGCSRRHCSAQSAGTAYTGAHAQRDLRFTLSIKTASLLHSYTRNLRLPAYCSMNARPSSVGALWQAGAEGQRVLVTPPGPSPIGKHLAPTPSTHPGSPPERQLMPRQHVARHEVRAAAVEEAGCQASAARLQRHPHKAHAAHSAHTPRAVQLKRRQHGGLLRLLQLLLRLLRLRLRLLLLLQAGGQPRGTACRRCNLPVSCLGCRWRCRSRRSSACPLSRCAAAALCCRCPSAERHRKQ